ncbi:ATP-binding protein [Streptomyces sp. NPDC056549]|uniref:ATP-binding protein n=1 Tax=Streptomyces sp. NPDC056549 TaxID=3345864 RepID=UPI003697067C
MLETLDARLIQAHGGELGHLDFLQVLCQGEITRRETVAFQRRLQKAKFEQQVTLEEFNFAASPKLPAAQIRDLATLRWLHAGESVILFGPVGVGKTHVAQALGHLAVRQGANVRFTKTSPVLAELAGDHADRTFPNPVVAESLLDRLINTSHQVIMNGPSYRPNKRPRNPTDK